jgi:hypothetical protein
VKSGGLRRGREFIYSGGKLFGIIRNLYVILFKLEQRERELVILWSWTTSILIACFSFLKLFMGL